MYKVARLLFVAWLVHPATQGSAYLYEQYIWPALAQASPDIPRGGGAAAAVGGPIGAAATLQKDCAPTVQRATAFLAVRGALGMPHHTSRFSFSCGFCSYPSAAWLREPGAAARACRYGRAERCGFPHSPLAELRGGGQTTQRVMTRWDAGGET